MKLSTEKEYVFISKTGELIIQSAIVKAKPHETLPTKVWINIQNYIEDKSGKKRAISVENFNKKKLTYIGEL